MAHTPFVHGMIGGVGTPPIEVKPTDALFMNYFFISSSPPPILGPMNYYSMGVEAV